MSKIAIISQPDQGVLIDVGGCTTLQEAVGHLTSTLQVSSQFWKGVNVALNLGKLDLTQPQVAQILAIAKGVGAAPKHVYSDSETTRQSLQMMNVELGAGRPMSLPQLPDEMIQHDWQEQETMPEDFEPMATTEETTAEYETQEAREFSEQVEEAETVEQTPAEDTPPLPPLPAVLYLRQTLRSGQTVSHKGHLVIVGDVNPGAEVMAEGDITVWGALRGVAHAGIGGNIQAEIRALKLHPIQIRIAHMIARSPDRPRHKFASASTTGPETARLIEGKIKVVRSTFD
jgi:septum site-determining protein MinC